MNMKHQPEAVTTSFDPPGLSEAMDLLKTALMQKSVLKQRVLALTKDIARFEEEAKLWAERAAIAEKKYHALKLEKNLHTLQELFDEHEDH